MVIGDTDLEDRQQQPSLLKQNCHIYWIHLRLPVVRLAKVFAISSSFIQ
jgi:hypothetical protein